MAGGDHARAVGTERGAEHRSLVLAPSLGITFFLGGFLMWIVLGRWLKWSDTTLTTIAVGIDPRGGHRRRFAVDPARGVSLRRTW
jgi:hypothetical protein